jgi:hypothetical protein
VKSELWKISPGGCPARQHPHTSIKTRKLGNQQRVFDQMILKSCKTHEMAELPVFHSWPAEKLFVHCSAVDDGGASHHSVEAGLTGVQPAQLRVLCSRAAGGCGEETLTLSGLNEVSFPELHFATVTRSWERT